MMMMMMMMIMMMMMMMMPTFSLVLSCVVQFTCTLSAKQ